MCRTIHASLLALLSVALGAIAWILCMTETNLGGFLPWALLTAGPALGAFLGHHITSR